MNEAILDAINEQAGKSPVVDAVARFLANEGIFVLAGILVLVGLFELRRNPARALQIASAAVVALLTTGGLILVTGHFIVEQRPFTHDSDTVLLIKHAADSSFPSDHAAVSAAAAAVGMLAWPRLSVWLASLVVVTGAARVFVGVHYPGDVVGGWVGGAAAAMLAWVLTRWAWEYLPARRPNLKVPADSL